MSSERTIGPVDAVIFGLVPAVVFAILMAVLLGDTGAADLDLQLMVPAEVGPGETIPARALLLDQVGGDRVPVPVQRTVVVRLTDEAGTEVTRTALHGSASLGMEGELPGPEPADVRAAGGSFWVHARVELDAERRASVRAPLRVSDRPGVARVRGRLALPLQQYEAGVVIAEDGQIPPSALELRVRGGACVPELPCDLLIHVGRPAAATRLVGSGAVTVLGEEGGGETDGIVALRVITHGPEASVDVEALRAGVLVARRTVRLPIALAGLRAGLDRVLLSPQGAPSLVVTRQLVQEQAAVLLDAFHEERWRVAGSLDATASAGPTSWPSPPLSPGLWCIQARTDPFGVDSAATVLFFVSGAAPSSAADGSAWSAALRELAASRAEAGDPYAQALRGGEIPLSDPETQAAFMLAVPELDLRPMPAAMSGYQESAAGLDEERDTWRRWGAAAVLLLGLIVVIFAVVRGLAAVRQARALLSATDEEQAPRGRRVKAVLVVFGIALLAGLAFVGTALVVLARGL